MKSQENSAEKRLKKELAEVDKKIQAQKERLPPHSVQPNLIAELDELEEQRDLIIKKLNNLKLKDKKTF